MPVVVVQELYFGIARLEQGRRKEELGRRVGAMLAGMGSRTLAYGTREAAEHGNLRARAQRSGRGLSAEDGQVLAIAIVNGAAVATRDSKDFEGYGVEVIDPWACSRSAPHPRSTP